ncbi:MAG: hypothetical protein E7I31_12055 [Staphylococcus lugdunensis]|nr:hypothetical protein [Staphylococcus lugdunensis]
MQNNRRNSVIVRKLINYSEISHIVTYLIIRLFFKYSFIFSLVSPFQKIHYQHQKKKTPDFFATLLTIPFIYIGSIFIWLFTISYYPDYSFNKKKWSTNQETRYELSKDIIGSRMLIGKTKLEVLKILGDENNKIEENHWIYYLGTRPELFNIDPDMLKIEFIDGKVIKVSQHPT